MPGSLAVAAADAKEWAATGRGYHEPASAPAGPRGTGWAYRFPRCRILPEPAAQTSLVLGERERCRWQFGTGAPRSFFYPLLGPSGHALTRMGHPGAPNHDHHRLVWFAHAAVGGVDLWRDHSESRIRQKRWLAYVNGDQEAMMAVELAWEVGHEGEEVLTQELVAAVRPEAGDGFSLELQSTFMPRSPRLVFDRTNFGFLAVRVAASICEYFGGGRLTSSDGSRGEKAIFGRPARWMDYSGPVPGGRTEGITYFDHPANPGYPNPWHVREDGWMGCGPWFKALLVATAARPLVLRYLLQVHGEAVAPDAADRVAVALNDRPAMRLAKSTVRHRPYEVRREAASGS